MSLNSRKFQKSQTSFAVKRVSNKSINYASRTTLTHGHTQQQRIQTENESLEKLSDFTRNCTSYYARTMLNGALDSFLLYIKLKPEQRYKKVSFQRYSSTHIPILTELSLFAQSK